MKIKFKERTGEHLFEFMRLSLNDADIANRVALYQHAVLDNGESLSLEQILNIQNKNALLYLKICNSIFAIDEEKIIDHEDRITFLFEKVLVIEKKKIDSSLLQEIQTLKAKMKKGREIDLLKNMITMFFDIDENTLLESNYIVAMGLSQQVNNFLSETTTTRNDFDISDELLGITASVVSEPLDLLDRASGRTSEETAKIATQISL
ncbi:MAG: hypothetical protein HC907_17800 [Richelia sp. SM1_7_0]|nr:hypothetical protein [Richelia sp. SM1_7_0]